MNLTLSDKEAAIVFTALEQLEKESRNLALKNSLRNQNPAGERPLTWLYLETQKLMNTHFAGKCPDSVDPLQYFIAEKCQAAPACTRQN